MASTSKKMFGPRISRPRNGGSPTGSRSDGGRTGPWHRSLRFGRRRPALAAGVLAVALAASGAVAGQVSSAAAAGPTRVMLLGDSITAAAGCWRRDVSRIRIGGNPVDMVGSQNNARSCGSTDWDADHEGHSGITAATVASGGSLSGWLSAAKPDVVGVFLGTNDIWGGRSADETVRAIDSIVNTIRSQNSGARIVVAQLPPVSPPSCGQCPQRTRDFNSALGRWAGSKGVGLVDLGSGWNASGDTTDGVHPNGSGTSKLAQRWSSALSG